MQKNVLIAMTILVSSASLASAYKDAVVIRKQEALWVKAAATRNVDAWMTFYAPGATVLPPNEPGLKKMASIRKSMAQFMALPNLHLAWKPDSVIVAKAGDVAYSYGTFKMSFTGPNGKQVEDHGKYVEVWKKLRNGSWKCLVDIWNSDLPASGA